MDPDRGAADSRGWRGELSPSVSSPEPCPPSRTHKSPGNGEHADLQAGSHRAHAAGRGLPEAPASGQARGDAAEVSAKGEGGLAGGSGGRETWVQVQDMKGGNLWGTEAASVSSAGIHPGPVALCSPGYRASWHSLFRALHPPCSVATHFVYQDPFPHALYPSSSPYNRAHVCMHTHTQSFLAYIFSL